MCFTQTSDSSVAIFEDEPNILGEEAFRPRLIDNSDEVSDERLQFP